MNIIYYSVLEVVIGFASGIIIGGGFVGLLTVLGVIPRLVHLSNSKNLLAIYPLVIISGVMVGTYLAINVKVIYVHKIVLIIWGGLQVVFNVMNAAALAEIVNVFPILAKRIGLQQYILMLVNAIVLGKIFGSLFPWIYIVQ